MSVVGAAVDTEPADTCTGVGCGYMAVLCIGAIVVEGCIGFPIPIPMPMGDDAVVGMPGARGGCVPNAAPVLRGKCELGSVCGECGRDALWCCCMAMAAPCWSLELMVAIGLLWLMLGLLPVPVS